jgi:hypothetical protein
MSRPVWPDGPLALPEAGDHPEGRHDHQHHQGEDGYEGHARVSLSHARGDGHESKEEDRRGGEVANHCMSTIPTAPA